MGHWFNKSRQINRCSFLKIIDESSWMIKSGVMFLMDPVSTSFRETRLSRNERGSNRVCRMWKYMQRAIRYFGVLHTVCFSMYLYFFLPLHIYKMYHRNSLHKNIMLTLTQKLQSCSWSVGVVAMFHFCRAEQSAMVQRPAVWLLIGTHSLNETHYKSGMCSWSWLNVIKREDKLIFFLYDGGY